MNVISNEPIKRALVRVNSGGEQHTAFTGADGRFEIANISEGPAAVSADRPGYLDSRSVPGSPFSRNNATYRVSPGTNDFKIFLTPESKLSGTVLDGEGEAVEGMQIQVFAYQITNGRKQLISGATGVTDENGAYRIDGQSPGGVMICSAALPTAMFASRMAEVYPPRCFPNSPDLTSAQTIELAAGQEARADFAVRALPAFTVTGVVEGAMPGFGVGVWVDSAGGGQTSFGFTRVDPATGRFAMRSVPSGTWRFHFSQNDNQGNFLNGYQDVTVSDADVSQVRVRLQLAPQISVDINRPAGQAGQMEQFTGPKVQVHLVSAEEGKMGEYYSSPAQNGKASPEAAQALAIKGVPPGSYKVFAQALGIGCVDSIGWGTTDLSREPLSVAGGASMAPIVINLSTDCATLEVRPRANAPEQTSVVLLVSDQEFHEPAIIQIQGGSAATFANVAPGSYRVYALSDVEGLEYTNQQALRGIPSESVTLAANEKSSVTMDVVRRRP